MAELFGWLKANPLFSGGAGLALVGGFLAYFRTVPGMVWNFISSRTIATLTVTSDEDAFLWMQHWFAELQSKTRAYAVIDSSDKYSNSLRFGSSAREEEADVRLRLGPGTHLVRYQKHWILVTLLREKTQSRSRSYAETLTLKMWRGHKADLQAVVQQSKEIYTGLVEKSITVWTYSEGDWNILGYRTRRPHDSVILPSGVLERLLQDAHRFTSEREWYVERGIPHRRGYLFTGPPGNGKSSMAQMLASECHLDMYVLNLAERYMTDQGLQRAVGEMQKNALLLLEDADAAGITREPTAEGTTGVTFSGVLNALDGITASEGRVVVLTTNYPEKLDPALIRPGRVDMVLDLPNATGVQAGALYERILGHPGRAFGARIPDGVYSMAQLQEHLIRFRHDPEAAVDAPLER